MFYNLGEFNMVISQFAQFTLNTSNPYNNLAQSLYKLHRNINLNDFKLN